MSATAAIRPHDSENPIPSQRQPPQSAKKCKLGWRDFIMFTIEGVTAFGAGGAGIASCMSSTKGTEYLASAIAGMLTAATLTEITLHIRWKRDLYLAETQRINRAITDNVEGIKCVVKKTEQVRMGLVEENKMGEMGEENKMGEQEKAIFRKAQSDFEQTRLNREGQIHAFSETKREESEENTTLLQ